MAGRRNKNKKKNKSEGKTQYESEEQKRDQEKKNETIKKETANQSGSSGLKCENKKKDQIEKSEPIEVTEKEKNKTVDTSCHHSATENSQVKTLEVEMEPEKEVSLLQTGVTDNKENSELEIVAERNEQVDDVFVKVSGPRGTNITNSVFQNHLEQESGDETVHPATPAIQSNLIKDEDVENKVSDEFKDMRKKDESEEVPDDDKTDTNMTLHDKKISDDQLNPQEIKPEQPASAVVGSTVEYSKDLSMIITNSLDGKADKEQDVETELQKQPNQAMMKVIVREGTPNIKPEPQPQEDGTDKCIQNSLRDQNIKYLRGLFRPLILEALQDIKLSGPQNAKGLEKKSSQPVVDETNNIKEMKDQLQNKREPSDQPQNEKKATEQLQNMKESNNQFQDDKEPNDQRQYKQVPTEQLQNEKKTFNQLQKPKEEEVQNIILSSPQSTKGFEKESSQSIADESNSIREPNNQFQNEKTTTDQLKKNKNDDVQIVILSGPQNATRIEKEAMQSVVDEINNIKEMKDLLQNKQEPNDQSQNEEKATERLQNMKESNNQFQNDKEPNDQRQYKQVPTEQLQNEEKTFDQLQKPKEEDVHNIILSSPQNTKGLEKETSHSIADESNSIREPNNQFQNKVTTIEQLKKMKKDDVLIFILSSLQNAAKFEKEAVQSIADESNNIREPNNQFQNKEKAIDQLKKTKNDDVQIFILSSSQNATIFEKEALQSVVDETNNIKEIKDQLQNEQEPNDQSQNKKKTTERLQNTKEPDDQFQDDKEPNDRRQYKQIPTEQLQNEKKIFDELQKPKEEDAHNIILSILKNTRVFEREPRRSIAEKSNSIREPNNQFQNEGKTIDQLNKMKKDDVQSIILSSPQNAARLEKKALQSIADESNGIRELNDQLQNGKLKNGEQPMRNDQLQESKEIKPIRFSTRIEEPDEVQGYGEVIPIDLTEIQIEKAVEQQNREQQLFTEEELKEEVKRNDQVVEANDSIVETNGSLDLVTTFGTAQGAEIKPLQELLRFHAVHGDNIRLSKNNFRAQRKKKSNFFSKGIAFSSRPVAVGEKVSFHLRQLSSYWLGLITIGFTTNDPMSIADNLPTNVIIERDCVDGFWAEHLDKKYYQESCRLHYYLNSSGNMCFGVNDVDKIEFLWNLETTKPVWALIDVFGYFTIVEFDIPKELRDTSFVKSSFLSDKTETGNSFNQSLDDNEKNKPCLNYQIRFVPLDLYTQVKGSCIKFLEHRGVCVTSDDKGGCIEGKLPLFPGQTIVVQKLSAGKALFFIGVKYDSPTSEVTSTLPEPVQTNVVMHVKDELAITFTETGEIRVTKNLDVPKIILKVNRSQKLWPFIKIFKINQMIKIWSNNISALAAFHT